MSKHTSENTSERIDTTERAWWKEAVIYQIYPRSFKDSDGDGIGDLTGILTKLDYIQNLGVDVIWLNPIFLSPNDDNGYDISDYYEIMKEFGSMEDFDRLLHEIHKRGLRLVLDLVVNHTSDEHPWFEEARKSRTNPYYTYYHWWPAEQGEPPLRPSYFDEDGTAWAYNKQTDSYYLHYFSRKQPDLNWENPDVRREIFDIMKFWFDKGIDGFRMDSISLIAKDVSFPEIDLKQFPGLFEFYAKGQHLHDYLHEMNRAVLSHYDCMSVGEGSAVPVEDVAKFVDPDREELNMLYHFDAARIRNTSLPDFPDTGIDYSLIRLKKMFDEWDKAVDKGWPSIYLGNHDQPRMISRFGSNDPRFRSVSAKMLATFLLTMRGTPYWFAGDEIGMCNICFENIDDYNDIDTKNRYKKTEKEGGNTQAFLEEQKQIGRDNARTPFQWDKSANAGFTTGKPWIKVNPDYQTFNVISEEKEKDSILNYFKKVIVFRKENPNLVYGTFTLLDINNPRAFLYLRESEGDRFLVALNFTPLVAIALPGFLLEEVEVVLCNYKKPIDIDVKDEITLRPFEAIVLKLHPKTESYIDSLDLLE
ncbi:alpha-glucosidase [uncultured Parabacteroides sp.]|uniref:glycoside hydrolase family 13 protein n=1 Tax=uncultured Parabacteroides sp. TaxID=512312 RepID=UPI0025EBDA9F|nr:alpha-glucosidase [uncultured Parabacteroides sp.]